MSNEQDEPTGPPIGSPICDKKVLPLTPEQRAFAEVIGREIARLWRDAHRPDASVRQPGAHDARAAVNMTTEGVAGRN